MCAPRPGICRCLQHSGSKLWSAYSAISLGMTSSLGGGVTAAGEDKLDDVSTLGLASVNDDCFDIQQPGTCTSCEAIYFL